MYDYKECSIFFTQNGLDKINAVKEGALKEGHDLWVNDVPVAYTELRDWLLTLKKELPDFQFLPARAEFTNTSHRTVVSFEVAMGGIPYTLGRIGVNKDWGKDLEFIVRSPNIYNARGKGQDQYRTSTRSLATAIKNVKKYILPMQAGEILKLSYAKVGEKISAERWKWNKEWGDGVRGLQYNVSRMMRSLIKLKETGQWDGYLEDTVNHMAMVDGKHEEAMGKRPNFYFVHVIGTRATVIDVSPREKDWTTYETGDPVSMDVSELPQEIIEGIAVLSVLEKGDGVEGVGYRQHDNVFFVHKKSTDYQGENNEPSK